MIILLVPLLLNEVSYLSVLVSLLLFAFQSMMFGFVFFITKLHVVEVWIDNGNIPIQCR